jgi:thiol-disulfide isomerase/thioredoxin
MASDSKNEYDDDPTSELPLTSERTLAAWPLFVLLFVAALALIVLQVRRPRPPNPWIGRAMPPIEAAGWLNTERAITNEDLRGKLVVVDYWDTGCPPCVMNMPNLVRLKDKYKDRGLVVLGLTAEESMPGGQLSRYVGSVSGLDWPIGYGAVMAFQVAGIEWLPTYVLYDGTGRALWGGHDLDDLEDALIARLARG